MPGTVLDSIKVSGNARLCRKHKDIIPAFKDLQSDNGQAITNFFQIIYDHGLDYIFKLSD